MSKVWRTESLALYFAVPAVWRVFHPSLSPLRGEHRADVSFDEKNAAELRKAQAEKALQQSIIDLCEKFGFSCRFLFESAIITTQISSWQFYYHESRKTLRHESTVKINFDTGNYAFTHEQFRNRKMTCAEIIEYIAAHEVWKQSAGVIIQKKGSP